MDRLILIPARAGSTRVRDKNLRELHGKPLLSYVIEAARQANCGRIVVSTNSEQIAAVAAASGAETPFMRPDHLATATSSSISTILHALTVLRETEGVIPDVIAFCPPTNPLLRSATIREMFIALERDARFNSIVTITRARTHPFRIVQMTDDGGLVNGIVEINGKTINDVERSQDWPLVWEGSPAARVTRAGYFLRMLSEDKELSEFSGKTYDVSSVCGYEISAEEAFDVDEELDLLVADCVIKRRMRES